MKRRHQRAISNLVRLEALTNESTSLEMELEDFLQETQQWDETSKESQSSSDKPSEVSKYEKFVAEHGRYGGWNDNDHVMFVQIFTKYTTKKVQTCCHNLTT